MDIEQTKFLGYFIQASKIVLIVITGFEGRAATRLNQGFSISVCPTVRAIPNIWLSWKLIFLNIISTTIV